MGLRSSTWLALAGATLALVAARPARGDITVIGRYTFVDGDTATRASFFSSRRIRVSTPDGREVILDSKADRVTLIDHRRHVYWDGPVARADSIVDVTDGSRWDLMLRDAGDALKAEWIQAMQFPPESIEVDDGGRTRAIAGYPCDRRTLRAGAYLAVECWNAAALALEPDYESTQDVVLAAVLDPVARAIMSMFWRSQGTTGLCLAATMTFTSPSQHGRFQWEAVQVIGARIPASAWTAPAGYGRAGLATAIAPDGP